MPKDTSIDEAISLLLSEYIIMYIKRNLEILFPKNIFRNLAEFNSTLSR
jgi:hypothetical protein